MLQLYALPVSLYCNASHCIAWGCIAWHRVAFYLMGLRLYYLCCFFNVMQCFASCSVMFRLWMLCLMMLVFPLLLHFVCDVIVLCCAVLLCLPRAAFSLRVCMALFAMYRVGPRFMYSFCVDWVARRFRDCCAGAVFRFGVICVRAGLCFIVGAFVSLSVAVPGVCLFIAELCLVV